MSEHKKKRSVLLRGALLHVLLLFVLTWTLPLVSNAALAKPKITTQPTDKTVSQGKKVSFSVKATGKKLTYRWYYQKPGQKTWHKLTSASSKTRTLSFTAKASQNGYSYKCIVKNSGGSVTSSIVKLTVVKPVTLTFTPGCISTTDLLGKEYYRDYEFRLKSEMYPMESLSVVWKKKAGYKYMVVFYDENYNITDHTNWLTSSKTFKKGDDPNAAYFKVTVKSTSKVTSTTKRVLPTGCKFTSTAPAVKLTADKPVGQGQKNLIKRADQALNMKFTLTADMPSRFSSTSTFGGFKAKVTYTGLPYSAQWHEYYFVPNCVSWDTFMTAVKNPNSYLYSKTATRVEGDSFYGTVCSSFVDNLYDMQGVYTTYELDDQPEFERSAYQDAEHLEIGDMLLKERSHVMVVYGIDRDADGKVAAVHIVHQWKPLTELQTITPYGLQHYLDAEGYVAYKFKAFDQISFTETQWSKSSPHWNHEIIPRRGDRANWLPGEDIEIDVLSKGSYTHAALYKGDALVREDPLDGSLITYSGLESGRYKVCLTKGTKKGEFCYFNVVDPQVEVNGDGPEDLHICFDSSMGTAVWYDIKRMATETTASFERTYKITSRDRERGYFVFDASPGQWQVIVGFQNEFGIFINGKYTFEVS